MPRVSTRPRRVAHSLPKPGSPSAGGTARSNQGDGASMSASAPGARLSIGSATTATCATRPKIARFSVICGVAKPLQHVATSPGAAAGDSDNVAGCWTPVATLKSAAFREPSVDVAHVRCRTSATLNIREQAIGREPTSFRSPQHRVEAPYGTTRPLQLEKVLFLEEQLRREIAAILVAQWGWPLPQDISRRDFPPSSAVWCRFLHPGKRASWHPISGAASSMCRSRGCASPR